MLRVTLYLVAAVAAGLVSFAAERNASREAFAWGALAGAAFVTAQSRGAQ